MYIKYFVLFVSFNHCCGASNLIPTAIYSQPADQPYYHDRRPIGSSQPNTAHYYPVFPYPYPNTFDGELQYSASYPHQSSLNIPEPQPHPQQQQPQSQPQPQPNHHEFARIPHNTRSLTNVAQRPTAVENPVESSQRVNREPNRWREPQRLPVLRLTNNNNNINNNNNYDNSYNNSNHFSGKRTPKQNLNPNPKPMIPMLSKAELTPSTAQPVFYTTPASPLLRSNPMPPSRSVMRTPKLDKSWNAAQELGPRVTTITFKWPKAQRDQSSNMSQDNLQPPPTTAKHWTTPGSPPRVANPTKAPNRMITNNFQINSKPQLDSPEVKSQSPVVSQIQKYVDNQKVLKQGLTPTVDNNSHQTPGVEAEAQRETVPATTPLPPDNYSTEAIIPFNLSISEEPILSDDGTDRREKLSSVDSELSYQTQLFDSRKSLIDNYDSSVQFNDQMSPYETPFQSTGMAVPENEVMYANPESYTSSPPVPEAEDSSYRANDKYLTDDKNGSKLKLLLEQFIQQLDLLKLVAARELQKSESAESYGNYPSTVKDGDVIGTSLVEPSLSKGGLSYDDYQNQRSFEQNYANTDGKAYKDSDDKHYGRYGSRRPRSQSLASTSTSTPPAFGLPNSVDLQLSTADSNPKANYEPNPTSADNSEDSIVSDITLNFDS